MTESLYDRYKEALRAGHVAVLRGHLEDALVAYGEAARIAPDRALPRTSIGGVYLELGRPQDALAEFEAALLVGPGDEGALLGRAEALIRTGRPALAAESLDALAEMQGADGRHVDAVDTLQRALALEERGGRRRRYQRALRSLRIASGDRAIDGAIGIELGVLERPAVGPTGGDATAPRGLADPGADGTGVSGAGAGPETATAEGDDAGAEPGGAGTAQVEAEPEPSGPPDPRAAGERYIAAAGAARDAGDTPAAKAAFLDAAAAFADGGLTYAALDACREALSLDGDDIDLQLRYVSLYRTRGWRDLAIVKLGHLLRLADLDGDLAARERICAEAREAFPDDEGLAALCG
jgi:tetratricopeptide (TPR) repeat protein